MAGLQDKLFVLNHKKGLETLRQRHIEAIVRERFTIVGELHLMPTRADTSQGLGSVPVLACNHDCMLFQYQQPRLLRLPNLTSLSICQPPVTMRCVRL